MRESRSTRAVSAPAREESASDRVHEGKPVGEDTSPGDVEMLDVVLSDAQMGWIQTMAAEQTPAVDMRTMLGRVVDDAMARHDEDVRRRAERLEIYRASGYSEHHPDYPHVPRSLRDV
jgi:hypothetical protein